MDLKARIKICMIVFFIFVVGILGILALESWEEFQVNSHFKNDQKLPDVAMDDKGNFVVVWSSKGQDGAKYGIFAQRYDKNGNIIGSEFQVNTYTKNNQYSPAIAMDSKGNFVVVWASMGQDGSKSGIFGQRYDSQGGAVGSEFQINYATFRIQTVPDVAMDKSGDFVVVWQNVSRIHAQRYNSQGVAQGGEFKVNQTQPQVCWQPAVAMSRQGKFVVSWITYDANVYGIFARRYGKNGAPLGSEFRVNTYTQGRQYYPDVAMDWTGNFVIVWMSDGQDGSGHGIYLQGFNKSGIRIGNEFQVNKHTLLDQYYPAVASDNAGNLIITWTSLDQDGSKHGIYARGYDRTKRIMSQEFRVNSWTKKDQYYSKVAVNKKGNIVIVWQSEDQDRSKGGVYARRFKN